MGESPATYRNSESPGVQYVDAEEAYHQGDKEVADGEPVHLTDRDVVELSSEVGDGSKG